MAKGILILSFLLVIHISCFSQISFFIKPLFFTKTDEHRLANELYLNPKYLTTPYFTYYNSGITFIPNLNLGLNFGITLDKKHFFEFGISQESVGIRNVFILPNHAESENEGVNFYSPSNVFEGSVNGQFMKFDFDYNYQFLKTKNNCFSMRFIGGIGLFFNKNVTKNDYPLSSYNLYSSSFDQPDKNIYLVSHIYEYADITRVSPFIKAGFGFDFNTKKNRNLFSIDISYIHNFIYFVSASHIIDLVDNGVNKRITIDVGSRGSGFHFQISRRFQLYPWILLSKKKRESKIL